MTEIPVPISLKVKNRELLELSETGNTNKNKLLVSLSRLCSVLPEYLTTK